jgi:hypothetical protein
MPLPSIYPRLLVLTVLAWSALGNAQESGAEKRAKAGATSDPVVSAEAASATSGIGSIGEMIPEGMKNLKVRIPGFENGRATSLITADAMTRQDKNTLFAEKMTIKIFGVDPKEDVRVDTRTATYVLDTKVLSSDQRSRVSRSDFQLEGDTMIFDTTTSQGKMVGRVQMIIYDTTQFSQRPALPADAKPEGTTSGSQSDNLNTSPPSTGK